MFEKWIFYVFITGSDIYGVAPSNMDDPLKKKLWLGHFYILSFSPNSHLQSSHCFAAPLPLPEGIGKVCR
jgi:hypothetical protein